MHKVHLYYRTYRVGMAQTENLGVGRGGHAPSAPLPGSYASIKYWKPERIENKDHHRLLRSGLCPAGSHTPGLAESLVLFVRILYVQAISAKI